ncbi:MAG TPA: tautomerase family protein [Arthrobacter sp.]|nr:tautomerase family protein [Arthrobacter sp.]
MPLVRMDVNQVRGPQQLRAISRGIHGAILAECGIPERDYFHILTEHPAGRSSPRTPASASNGRRIS